MFLFENFSGKYDQQRLKVSCLLTSNCITIKKTNSSAFPGLNDENQSCSWYFIRWMDDRNVPTFLKFSLDAPEIQTIRERVAEYPPITHVDPPYQIAISTRLSVQEKLQQIQTYIQRLEYNYTGMQFFDLNASRPMSGLMDTARHM